jgi:hypothetical protein
VLGGSAAFPRGKPIAYANSFFSEAVPPVQKSGGMPAFPTSRFLQLRVVMLKAPPRSPLNSRSARSGLKQHTSFEIPCFGTS